MENIKSIVKLINKISTLLCCILVPLICFANYLIFILAPDEKFMGAVQRIFYFHVGSAFACYLAFGVVFIASIYYLITRHMLADLINESAAEVGFIFCSITLISGMIWGHSAWNTWFSWEPRLVSTLFLWLIFLSFLVLRSYGDLNLYRNHTAVLGIIGSLTVPLVWLSVKILPQVAQLHPQVIENRGLKDPMFVYAMVVSSLALIILMLFLLLVRIRLGILRQHTLEANI